LYITLILFLLILFLSFISITGFGKLFLKLSNLNVRLVSDFKNLEFIFGLIFVGFLGIIINFITNINDVITLCIILFGSFLYFLFFFKTKNKKKEIYLILLIVLVSFFFAFYSLSNDDFSYHFKTILFFKNYDIFEIPHGRRTSYNSHWLLINAVYYLKSFPASVFCISALFYSLTLFDFYASFKRNYNDSSYLPTIYSFFVLIFMFGVLNLYKNYGTDFPGQIIILYIFLIFFEKNKLIFNKNEFKVFIILVFLSFFAFTIKISNGLIFFLLFFIFFQMKRNIYLFFICLPCVIPILFWFIQNYLISSCLVWPLSFTCFDNIAQALQEIYIIEIFAKGDINANIHFHNFNWIPVWFENHFPKILETYAIYFVLLLSPPIFYKFLKLKIKSKLSFATDIDLYKLAIDNPYFIFSLISIFSSVIWFICTPAYRFGISYNLNFLIIFLIPLWHNIFLHKKLIFKKSVTILISISLVFFVYKNINKYHKYFDRYGTKWPNIIENEYIYKEYLIIK
jgi:hypothetical protein|tara:strand:+ start:237 stop:1772 length:1536 start_codon:yes stop_codon:yes gene_type:complete